MTDAAPNVVTLADRPDLAAGALAVLASRWPAFMLEGRPGHDADLIDMLVGQFPQHQIILLSGDAVIGAGLSLPVPWNGSDRPAHGWDDVVTQAALIAGGKRRAGVVSALSVTLRQEASGRGWSARIVRALRAAAASAGLDGMFVPVRPVLKSRYPLIPLDSYIRWTTTAGEVFDPWLRLHLDMGAQLLDVAEQSLTVRGTVADWERWTAMPMPSTGTYVVDGGLVPVSVDRERDHGVYREPNVWVFHS